MVQMVLRIKGFGFMTLILVLGLLLFAGMACGSQEAPASVEKPAAVESPSEEVIGETQGTGNVGSTYVSVAEECPDNVPQGGKLVRLYSDPPTLDPHLTTDSVSSGLVDEIYGGLATLDLDLHVVGDLAESWDISPDATVYTFHIRSNAKFHDGKPVTAHDVKWSLERVADPATQSPVAQLYLSDIVGVPSKLAGEIDSIQGVRIIDDHTIEITIDAPKAYFLSKLTYPTAFVLDRSNVEGAGDQWLRQPNGTGPFKLGEYKVGEVIRLTRNEQYHLCPAYLDEVELILSGGSAMLMYENDEIDVTGVGLADLERVLDPSSSLNVEIHEAPASFSVYYIGMNVQKPPFDDPKVRQALNFAIDKETIASQVLENQRRPAKGILPPGFPGFNPDLAGYEYNPELARKLLQESKYGGDPANMPRIVLSITGGFGASVSLDLEVILQSWEEELGIVVEIHQTEWATFLQDVHSRRYQMFQLGWAADYPDPENFLDILFHSKSDNTQTNYSNPDVDALLEQARVETDQKKRFDLYNQIEQMILDDAPWIPLWVSGENYVLVKPRVKGYHLTPMSIPRYRYVYIQE